MLGLRVDLQRLVQGDRQKLILTGKGPRIAALLQVRAVATVLRSDDFTVGGINTDLTRKREQRKCILQRDGRQIHRLEQRGRARFCRSLLSRLLRGLPVFRSFRFLGFFGQNFRHVGTVAAVLCNQHVSACGIDTQLASIICSKRKEFRDLLFGQFIGCDLGRHICARPIGLLQVGSVAADSQGDAISHINGVHRASIDIVSQGFNLELQAVSVALTVCTEVEGAQELVAIFVSRSDPVQIVFHRCRKVVVSQVRQVLFHQSRNREGKPGGNQVLSPVGDVAAIADGLNRCCIGRGATNSELFHGLHQGRFGVAARGLSLVSLRLCFFKQREFAFAHLREGLLSIGRFRVVASLVLAFLVGQPEAGGSNNSSRGAGEHCVRLTFDLDIGTYADGCGKAKGIRHL